MFWFKTSDGYVVYMGRDKFENEMLIENGWPEDYWFHVDSLSSAHVYIRLNRGERLSDVPEASMEECCQLVKENSIEGCKQASVKIVFTPWSNLRKDKTTMDIGTIGFHDMKQCVYRTVSKDRAILKRIQKTKSGDETPDYRKLRIERDEKERQFAKRERKSALEAAREAREEQERQAKLHSFDGLFDEAEVLAGKTLGSAAAGGGGGGDEREVTEEVGSAAAGGGGGGSGLSREERRARARARRDRRKRPGGDESGGGATAVEAKRADAGSTSGAGARQKAKRKGKGKKGTGGGSKGGKSGQVKKEAGGTKGATDADSLFGSDSDGGGVGQPVGKPSPRSKGTTRKVTAEVVAAVGAEFGDISSDSEEEAGGAEDEDDGFM